MHENLKVKFYNDGVKMKKILIGIIILFIVCIVFIISYLNNSKKMNIKMDICDGISIEKKEEILKNNIIAKKNILKYDGKNNNVIKIVKYINSISKNNWKEVEKIETFDNNVIEEKIDIVYKNDNFISFIIEMNGQIGATSYYGFNGYTFLDDGEVLKFQDNLLDDYYNLLVDKFMDSDIYKNNSNQLSKEWKFVLKKIMFEIGNYYLDDKNVYFIIPSWKLGLDESSPKIIEIEVPKINNN